MTNLLTLQKKYKHLLRTGDHLVEGVSGDFVKVSTNNYNFSADIINTKTLERYQIKYDGWKIPYKTLFDVSKRMAHVLSYSVKIPVYGRGYVLRRGTYRVAELVDGKLEEKRFPTVDKAIYHAKYLEQNNIEPELI